MRDLLDFLRRCKIDAAELATGIERHFLREVRENINHQTPYHFVRQVIRAVPLRRDQDMLLSLLVHQGSYSQVPNDPLRPSILRLRRRGVLQSVRPYSRVYCLTPEYRLAAETLARARNDDDTDEGDL